jgi:hypothetical protein
MRPGDWGRVTVGIPEVFMEGSAMGMCPSGCSTAFTTLRGDISRGFEAGEEQNPKIANVVASRMLEITSGVT